MTTTGPNKRRGSATTTTTYLNDPAIGAAAEKVVSGAVTIPGSR